MKKTSYLLICLSQRVAIAVSSLQIVTFKVNGVFVLVGGLFDSDKPALFDDESSNAADNVDAVQGKSSFEVEDHSDLLKSYL